MKKAPILLVSEKMNYAYSFKLWFQHWQKSHTLSLPLKQLQSICNIFNCFITSSVYRKIQALDSSHVGEWTLNTYRDDILCVTIWLQAVLAKNRFVSPHLSSLFTSTGLLIFVSIWVLRINGGRLHLGMGRPGSLRGFQGSRKWDTGKVVFIYSGFGFYMDGDMRL